MVNKNILLALLPPWGDNSFPPLGISSVSSNLIKNGYRVIKKDFNAMIYWKIISNLKYIFSDLSKLCDEDKYKKHALPVLMLFMNKWVDEIMDSNASIIGFTSYCTNRYTIKTISEMIKKRDPKKIIVVGGPEANNREFLTWGTIDFAVIGDGEESFLHLVDALLNNKSDYKNIHGLLYLDNKCNESIYTGDNTIRLLDDLPFPNFEGLDMSKYGKCPVPIEGSRGCINKCSFCGDVLLNKKFRFKSGKRLFNEFIKHVHCGHFDFAFVDSLLNGNIKELEIFCDLVIKSGINKGPQKITWRGNACIRKEMSSELLDKMNKAGCVQLNYGVESGSDLVLKKMNKQITESLASDVIKKTHLSGISVFVFIIIGFPTETENDFNETLNFIKKNREYISHIFAGKGCTIVLNSDLQVNPDKYGIYWTTEEQTIRKDAHCWCSLETTPDIRMQRVVALSDYCKSLNIASENLL